MNPTVKRAGKPCRQCGNLFRSRSQPTRAIFCNRSCSAKSRTRASRVAAGIKGGQRRQQIAAEQRDVVIQAKVEGLTPRQAFDAGRLAKKRQDNARLRVERRAGFSDGYEAGYDAAMKELTRRSA